MKLSIYYLSATYTPLIIQKVVVKDLDAYNQFAFEKLTKAHGIVKMQSSFVLCEIKHTTVLNIRETDNKRRR